MTPLTTLIMSSVPLGKAGVGSAMNDTTRELGGALGVAVLGSLVTSKFTQQRSPPPSPASRPAPATVADTGLAGALQVAGELGGAAGAVARRARPSRRSSTASAWPPWSPASWSFVGGDRRLVPPAGPLRHAGREACR